MITKIDSEMDRARGVVTYDLGNGRYACFSIESVRAYGLAECLKAEGIDYQPSKERVPVMRGGRRIGTLPGDFDPDTVKSKSFLYDARPGDFTLVDGAWVLGRTMGASDIDCVPGFVYDSPDRDAERLAQFDAIPRKTLDRMGVPADMTAGDVARLFSMPDDDDRIHMRPQD